MREDEIADVGLCREQDCSRRLKRSEQFAIHRTGEGRAVERLSLAVTSAVKEGERPGFSARQ